MNLLNIIIAVYASITLLCFCLMLLICFARRVKPSLIEVLSIAWMSLLWLFVLLGWLYKREGLKYPE